jgi:hypothetical protein
MACGGAVEVTIVLVGLDGIRALLSTLVSTRVPMFVGGTKMSSSFDALFEIVMMILFEDFKFGALKEYNEQR